MNGGGKGEEENQPFTLRSRGESRILKTFWGEKSVKEVES